MVSISLKQKKNHNRTETKKLKTKENKLEPNRKPKNISEQSEGLINLAEK